MKKLAGAFVCLGVTTRPPLAAALLPPLSLWQPPMVTTITRIHSRHAAPNGMPLVR